MSFKVVAGELSIIYLNYYENAEKIVKRLNSNYNKRILYYIITLLSIFFLQKSLGEYTG